MPSRTMPRDSGLVEALREAYYYLFGLSSESLIDRLRLWLAPLNFMLHLGRGGVLSFYVPGSRPLIVRTWDGFRFIVRPGTADLGLATLIGDLYELYEWFLPNASGIVVDVGANVGGYTARACRRADLVVAIEPLPDVFELLKRNVSLNCARHSVVLLKKAVYHKAGRVELRVPRIGRYYATGWGSIVKGGDLVYEAEADTLDNIVEALGIEKVDLLKIDIEGAEPIALEGMKKTLEKTDKLIIEIQPGNEKIISEITRTGLTLADKKETNYFFTRERCGNIDTGADK